MMNSFSVTDVKRESRMSEPDKAFIVEGEASESEEEVSKLVLVKSSFVCSMQLVSKLKVNFVKLGRNDFFRV